MFGGAGRGILVATKEATMRSDVAMPDYLRIRLFSDEKIFLKETAEKHGLSLSEFIRSKVLKPADCEAA